MKMKPADYLQKKSLRDEVFEVLHARIVAGEYAPGEWLRQEDISNQLGVSQTPVREALDRLVSVGLAERVPYRGVRVPLLRPEEILEAYVLRLVLESLAGRLAAHHITQDQIETLKQIVNQTQSLLTLEEMPIQRQLNKRFHSLLVCASGNSLLTKIYETVSNTFPDWMLYEYLFRHPELLPSSLEREYQEHLAILEAVAGGDGERAARGVVTHLRNLGHELEAFLGIAGSLIREKEAQIAPFFSTTNP